MKIDVRVTALLGATALAAGCNRIAADHTTPEGAVLVLEAAYGKKDLEAAVAARDFETEAKLMLEKIQPILIQNEGLVKKTAETLETTYRTKRKALGFPDLSGESSFFGREEVKPGLVRLSEKHVRADGSEMTRKVLVAKGPQGWRVVKFEE